MKKSEVITALIAAYGAILSTAAIIRQWKSDQVKVKLTVKRDREMVGSRRYAGMTLIEIRITNVGHRPITITSFGAIGLYPHPSLVGIESHPPLPCEIKEGQFISSYWPQDELDFAAINYWAVSDSEDREYKVREASLFAHWKSRIRQRREWRKRNKANVPGEGES